MKKRIIVLFAVLALSTSSSLFAFVGFENLGDVLYGGELDYGLDNGSLGGMRHTYFQHGVIVYYIFWEWGYIYVYGQEDIPCCYTIVAYPNPRTEGESMFIRLNVEANSELRVDDIQSIEYELIDPNQKRVTTFSPDKPIDVVEIEPDYLKLDGTYAVVGKLKYLLKNDIIETTITMPFDVLLQVKN